MNSIQAKTHINAINPYCSVCNTVEEDVISLIRKTRLYGPSDPETARTLADRVIDWSAALPLTNYERQIETAGATARALDWGVFGGVVGLEGIVMIDELFKFHVFKKELLNYLPLALRVITKPLSGFFFIMGVVEGAFETINLRRMTKLLYRFESNPEDLLTHLQWIKKHYFTLKKRESDKITAYIEKKKPHLSEIEKSAYFEKIADKALRVKFERLGRRITPGLAKAVNEEIDGIISDLQSSSNEIRAAAQKRAEVLMKSVTNQVKNKIIIHILALMSIACTIVSMIGLFMGVSLPLFFIILGVAATILMGLQFLGKRTVLDKGADQFYANLIELKAVP